MPGLLVSTLTNFTQNLMTVSNTISQICNILWNDKEENIRDLVIKHLNSVLKLGFLFTRWFSAKAWSHLPGISSTSYFSRVRKTCFHTQSNSHRGSLMDLKKSNYKLVVDEVKIVIFLKNLAQNSHLFRTSKRLTVSVWTIYLKRSVFLVVIV